MRGSRALVVALVVVLVVAAGLAALDLAGVRRMPACQEDAALVGEGEFLLGRWTRYRCGPAVDDYLACSVGDLNGDGRIDALDVQLLFDKVLQQGGPVDPGRVLTG